MIEHLLGRKFDRVHFNCATLTIDAWEILTGDRLEVDGSTVLTKIGEANFIFAKNFALLEDKGILRPVDRLQEPCIVGFFPPFREVHVGVWIHNKLLHVAWRGTSSLTDIPTDLAPYAKFWVKKT